MYLATLAKVSSVMLSGESTMCLATLTMVSSVMLSLVMLSSTMCLAKTAKVPSSNDIR